MDRSIHKIKNLFSHDGNRQHTTRLKQLNRLIKKLPTISQTNNNYGFNNKKLFTTIFTGCRSKCKKRPDRAAARHFKFRTDYIRGAKATRENYHKQLQGTVVNYFEIYREESTSGIISVKCLIVLPTGPICIDNIQKNW